ncbi:MAG: DUF362 domain-containing protein [Ruminococcaceae bacterium]|nr:DUF362 domain-containing protein [Oscillospiraceae bacterium]
MTEKKWDVSIVPCADYEKETTERALEDVLRPIGGLDWVTPGMRIAVKANLVSFMKPETAAVTHPQLLQTLCAMLTARGAEVTVGDSPGGTWGAVTLNPVYNATGVRCVEETGAKLNHDFGQREAEFPEGVACKRFPYTSWLDEADAVIDFCKLKTHGLAAMSCAVKNLFGVVPGTHKPEFHYLYPQVGQFCDMLVDINEYVRPRLTIVDAVMCMEGNGPTQGTPRHMGALIASESTYKADLLCAHLIGLDEKSCPTVAAAAQRGLCPADWRELAVSGDVTPFLQPDFDKVPSRGGVEFFGQSKLLLGFLNRCFGAYPKVDAQKCVGCGKCVESCPMDTVRLKNKRAVISRGRCIRCFCCQEFCPKGAITVGRTALAKLASKL